MQCFFQTLGSASFLSFEAKVDFAEFDVLEAACIFLSSNLILGYSRTYSEATNKHYEGRGTFQMIDTQNHGP